jgi:hypothetical protein
MDCQYPTYQVLCVYASRQDKAFIHALSHALQLRTSSPLPMWAPTLPCVQWFRTSPPCQGGFRRYHVSSGSGSHLPTEVGPDAATCSVASDLTSRLRWALTPLRATWLQTPPPDRGGFRCCHTSRGSQWAVGLKYIKAQPV